jgi:hypothetical protein
METNQEEPTLPSAEERDVNGDSGSEESNDDLGGYASPESVDQFYLNDDTGGEPSVSQHEGQWKIDHSSGDYKLRRKPSCIAAN